MIRVVLDTNIVVSAMLRTGGLPEAVFNLAINGVIRLFVSGPVLTEYEEVLRRSRLAIPQDKVAKALTSILDKSSLVTPTVRVTACMDPDDDAFLECAEAAGADYLITGNRKHCPDQWKKTRVVTAREFWEIAVDVLGMDPF
jgi:putative PIN family toxin of toxin-antitoxin system